jgi:hypothetical protein
VTGCVLAVLAAAETHEGARYYVASSPAACETIDYACPKGWRGFTDDKGCGCVRMSDDAGGRPGNKE